MLSNPPTPKELELFIEDQILSNLTLEKEDVVYTDYSETTYKTRISLMYGEKVLSSVEI